MGLMMVAKATNLAPFYFYLLDIFNIYHLVPNTHNCWPLTPSENQFCGKIAGPLPCGQGLFPELWLLFLKSRYARAQIWICV